jgi:TolB-like protein/Tfp pilus assembly protein PilF
VALPLPDKPSIAVLPFANMSGDPEQEFFADGMAEEIITALSRYRWFFVIARNSSFTYKGHAVDVTQVAKELGVRYVLEGSVRKADKRVRVTAQLIDATTGNHIWAERYDRELDDIFALQDEITEAIVTSIEPQLGAVERERARRKPPENLGAWDLFQRGLWHLFDDVKRDALAEAKRLFRRACELDPEFAAAHAELSYTHVAEIVRGLTDDLNASLDQAADAAERAVALDPRDPAAHVALGRVLIFRHSHERAMAEMEAALALNASFDRGHYGLGLALLYGGRPEESIPQFERAIRLSPRGPILWGYWMMLGLAYINLEKYEEAAASFEKAIQQPNADFMVFVLAASTLAHLGRIDEARALLAEAQTRKPGFSIDTVRSAAGQFGPHSGVARIIDGLRKAGLSEQ